MDKCIHILVRGKVQGVYFRASTRERALELGLRGIVHNLRDGRVEILVQGNSASIERFLGWCRQGPPNARVDDLQIQDSTANENFKTFTIAY